MMTEGQTSEHELLWGIRYDLHRVDLRHFPGPRWEAFRRLVWEARAAVAEATDVTWRQQRADRLEAERRSRLPGFRGDD